MRKLRLAGEIVLEYARANWTLRRKGMQAALEAVPRPVEGDDPREHDVSVRLGHAVDRTLSALPSDPRCLIRAVVLARLLARRGIGSRVVLGVRNAPEFTAHAWVEHGGLPLLPAGDYQQGRLAEF